MKWVTREKIKVDRVACPWLIKKFIDGDAEFVFLPHETDWTKIDDGIVFDVPNCELGHHDEDLLQTVAVKQLCRKAGIDRVDAGPNGAVISFRKDSFARPDRLIQWITRQAGTAKVRPDQKLVLMRAWDDAAARFESLTKTLAELAGLAEEKPSKSKAV